jgi:hypothetical protein
MKDESSNLLDLDSLSVRLTKIAEGLEKAKGADIIQRLVSVVLNLMAHREEYYYQFSQGDVDRFWLFFSGAEERLHEDKNIDKGRDREWRCSGTEERTRF